MLGLVLAAACSGGTTPPSNAVKTVEVTPPSLQLRLASIPSAQLTATPRNAAGAAVTGSVIAWRSSNATVVTVTDQGSVSAVAEGAATIFAAAGGVEGSATVQVLSASVATVTVSLGSPILQLNQSTQATALMRDAAGGVLSGRAVLWSSSNTAVASVNASGLVTAVSAGAATIIATSEGIAGSAGVQVSGVLPNLTLESVFLTQAVQRADGTIPLVAGGNPVLVNIYGTQDRGFPSGAPVPRMRVRVFNGTTQLMVDERPMSGALSATVNFNVPAHQLVLPVSVVNPGLRILVTIDPDSLVPELTLSDNSWPRSGQAQTIAVQPVPALPLHFVPIFLSNGGSTGTVSMNSLTEYLFATRQMHPVSVINADIGPVFSSDVAFGDGQQTAWVSILQQLDVLRVMEGSSSYYMGALRPPPGITFVQFGGFSYIPSNPQNSGPSTRTSVIVGVGWFSRARATTELVAHELGHTLGRRHAPCGGAASPDPGYPYANAAIGVYGHDLYSYSLGGVTTPAQFAPTAASDVMSYCLPVWISDYNYSALLQARTGIAAMTAASPPSECECLIVWGSVENDSVHLNPAFVTRGRVALPDRPGSYRVVGRDEAGTVLFGYDFDAAVIDHAPGVRHFTFAIPIDATARVALSRIQVLHAGRSSELRARALVGPGTAALTAGTVHIEAARIAEGQLEVRWERGAYGAVIVRDPITDRVLGIGTSGRMRVRTDRTDVDVVLSDGVRSTRATLRALPR
jgi:hypothetical protein